MYTNNNTMELIDRYILTENAGHVLPYSQDGAPANRRDLVSLVMWNPSFGVLLMAVSTFPPFKGYVDTPGSESFPINHQPEYNNSP